MHPHRAARIIRQTPPSTIEYIIGPRLEEVVLAIADLPTVQSSIVVLAADSPLIQTCAPGNVTIDYRTSRDSLWPLYKDHQLRIVNQRIETGTLEEIVSTIDPMTILYDPTGRALGAEAGLVPGKFYLSYHGDEIAILDNFGDLAYATQNFRRAA